MLVLSAIRLGLGICDPFSLLYHTGDASRIRLCVGVTKSIISQSHGRLNEMFNLPTCSFPSSSSAFTFLETVAGRLSATYS